MPYRARNLINLIFHAYPALLPLFSEINCHHSFRSFRAQSLNLINVAVHTKKTVRVGAVKIQRRCIGFARYKER